MDKINWNLYRDEDDFLNEEYTINSIDYDLYPEYKDIIIDYINSFK